MRLRFLLAAIIVLLVGSLPCSSFASAAFNYDVANNYSVEGVSPDPVEPVGDGFGGEVLRESAISASHGASTTSSPTFVAPRGLPNDGGLFRRTTNSGEFAGLAEPMQLRHVRRTAADAGVGLDGVRVRIDRNPDLVGRGVYGHTTPDGRTITLYPDAFTSREQLVRTLGHERMHVYQSQTFGPPSGYPDNKLYEGPAIASESDWWEYAQSVGAGG